MAHRERQSNDRLMSRHRPHTSDQATASETAPTCPAAQRVCEAPSYSFCPLPPLCLPAQPCEVGVSLDANARPVSVQDSFCESARTMTLYVATAPDRCAVAVHCCISSVHLQALLHIKKCLSCVQASVQEELRRSMQNVTAARQRHCCCLVHLIGDCSFSHASPRASASSELKDTQQPSRSELSFRLHPALCSLHAAPLCSCLPA